MVNTFAGFYLDRRAELRDDPDWADQARADGETLFVLAAGLAQLVSHEPQPEIAFVRADHPLVADAPDSSLTLLGWFRGARCVLVDIGHASDERLRLELPAAARLEELRPLASILPKDSAGLLAYARALMFWRERHRFCGVCGRATMPGRAGHVLNCRAADSGCGASFFPRLDPAVIVPCWGARRPGRRDAIPPSLASSNRARVSRMPSPAKSTKRLASVSKMYATCHRSLGRSPRR